MAKIKMSESFPPYNKKELGEGKYNLIVKNRKAGLSGMTSDTTEFTSEKVTENYENSFKPNVEEADKWGDAPSPTKSIIDSRGSYGIYNPKNEQEDLKGSNIKYDKNGYPINPFLLNEKDEQIRTTGVTGRGNLGKWGPNHAADSSLFRITKGEDGKFEIQQLIITRPTKELAMPGGMIDRGEVPLEAALRELGEEAMDLKADLLNDLLNSSFYIGAGANGDARSTR